MWVNRRMRIRWKDRQGVRRWPLILLLLMSPLCWVSNAEAQTEVIFNFNNTIIRFDPTTVSAPAPILSSFALIPHRANVSWSAVPGASSYQLEWQAPNSSAWTLVYNGTGHFYSALELIAGQHFFRVAACDESDCSNVSNTSDVTIVQQLDSDLDQDGVLDYQDDCLATGFGLAVDAQGCSENQRDSDQDGVSDAMDLCPDTPPNTPVSAAGCPPTTVDSDGDGVSDDLDWCAGTVSGEAVDEDGCALAQIDSDGDGIADHLDAYPHQSAFQCVPGGG